MLVADTFKQLVEQKYNEAKEEGVLEKTLDGRFGHLTIYINNKPKSFVSEFIINDEPVYVGGNNETKVSS
jgi:hypothetical protein